MNMEANARARRRGAGVEGAARTRQERHSMRLGAPKGSVAASRALGDGRSGFQIRQQRGGS